MHASSRPRPLFELSISPVSPLQFPLSPTRQLTKPTKAPPRPPPPFAAPPPAFDPPAIPPATTLALAPASAPASAAVPRSSLSAAAAAAAASAASAGGAPSSAATPGALAALVARREKLEEQVASAERQLFDLETAYLHDSAHTGSVLRGFDSLLAAPRAASSSMKRPRKFLAEDRLFSLSSCTSSAAEEQATGRDAGVPPTPSFALPPSASCHSHLLLPPTLNRSHCPHASSFPKHKLHQTAALICMCSSPLVPSPVARLVTAQREPPCSLLLSAVVFAIVTVSPHPIPSLPPP
ncbi:unnamed protein product [Closterium sp. NIES-64]|nr:unnamed protein product [Closterium sp. NIES-64]